MFFRGRKKKEEALLKESEIGELEAWFLERLEDVDRTEGADDKLLRLEEIREAIDAKILQRAKAISKETGKKVSLTAIGAYTAGIGAVTAATVATGGAAAPLFYLAIPAAWGSAGIGGLRGGRIKKRLERDAAQFFGALQAQKDRITELETRLVSDHVNEIAHSPRRAEIFEKYGHLQSHFAEVAAKKMAEAKDALPEARDKLKKKSPFGNMPKPDKG